jgi:enoyl-CoA hydratase
MSVHYEQDGDVVTITIDRPEVRNAIDRPTARELADGSRRFDGDLSAAVAVLHGAHGTFCAGADLKAVAGASGATAPPKATPEGDGPLGPTRMLLSKPVIAAVSGYAVAGGLELALWCDLRIAEETAVFGCFERRWGVPLIDGGTWRLPRVVGFGRAMEMILTGRPVSAGEALAMGLANEVVPEGGARARAQEMAAEIAAFPQFCLRSDRWSAYQVFGLGPTDALRREAEIGIEVIRSGETAAGAARFSSGEGRHGTF